MKKPLLPSISIQEAITRLLRIAAERIFLSFLSLFLLALLIAGAVWYQSLRMESSDRAGSGTVFQQDRFLEIIRIQEERAKYIQAVLLKEYRDIFSPTQEID